MLVVVSFLIAIVHQFVVAWYSPFMRTILDTGRMGCVGADDQFGGADLRDRRAGRSGPADQTVGVQTHHAPGACAYLLRAVLFALVFMFDIPFAGQLCLAGAGQALHGFCFGCFMAVGYMYVDKVAPVDVRGSMQTLYGVFVLSLGFFVGGLVSGVVGRPFHDGNGCVGSAQLDRHLAQLRGDLSVVCVLLFAAFFPPTPRVARGEGCSCKSGEPEYAPR